ncbi:CD2-associated protein isoform X1 [Electrophorus electricus]|uniref:CD2-associated protein isoform X1 n=1 Tax=Electrophorus electricus TaxID=8005 RepID=UPI0015D02819|nr:CD2-associated protein isoform X1 [Electrophorus electricus]
MVEVVVEFEYEAMHDDELTLRLGDVIKNVRRIEEEGWMEGDLNGRRGLFPDNFVKELKKETKDVKDMKEVKELKDTRESEAREDSVLMRRSSGNVASLVQRISTFGIPAGGLGFQPRTAKKRLCTSVTGVKKRQCKVLFEYVPQNEDELELKPGDIIEITEEVEEGWWSGTMNGKSGLFPSNFVKEIETSEEGESGELLDEPDGKDEITSPVSPYPGNGVIAQPKKVRGVGFGDIFREGSVKLKVRLTSENEEKKEKPLPSLPPAAKPTHSSTPDAHKVEKDGECKGKVKEYCRATFTYEATNLDELDIKDGDIIQVLSKDTGEPGWWRGEVGGKEGVFPDNFVVLISETDKEKPKKPAPPSKSTVSKPEVPSSDKKPTQTRPEDKVDRAVPEKPAKAAAPIVPPKKPIPPPGRGLPRPVTVKRPEKPLTPAPAVNRHNGEVLQIRPKSELEPPLPSKPKTLSGDWGEKNADTDLLSFDDVSSTSEKLSHPTASRPKMPGRRLPAHFSPGQSPNKEGTEKAVKTEEEEMAKPKSSETWRASPSVLPSATAYKAAPDPAHNPTSSPTPEPKAKAEAEVEEERGVDLEELRTQMKDLVLSVELLKTQQARELSEIRNELEEERAKRVALQLEIEKCKKLVQST